MGIRRWEFRKWTLETVLTTRYTNIGECVQIQESICYCPEQVRNVQSDVTFGGSDGYQVKAGTGFRRTVRRRDKKKKTKTQTSNTTTTTTTTTKPSIAAAYGRVTQDFDGAKRLVQSQGKGYILLVFSGSDWCGWCQVMDRNVFKQKRLGEVISWNERCECVD